MIKTIVLPFDMDKLKILTQVRFITKNRKNPTPFDAYMDTGSTDTERQIKGLDKASRFYRTDIFSRNILVGVTEHEMEWSETL